MEEKGRRGEAIETVSISAQPVLIFIERFRGAVNNGARPRLVGVYDNFIA